MIVSERVALDQILESIHALEEDLIAYERKYGILSETFYASFLSGEEPQNDAWTLDWSSWAGAYESWLRLHEQYRAQIRRAQRDSRSLASLLRTSA